MKDNDPWEQLRGALDTELDTMHIIDTAQQTEGFISDMVVHGTATASFKLSRPSMIEVPKGIFVPQADVELYDLRAYYNEIWC